MFCTGPGKPEKPGKPENPGKLVNFDESQRKHGIFENFSLIFRISGKSLGILIFDLVEGYQGKVWEFSEIDLSPKNLQ